MGESSEGGYTKYRGGGGKHTHITLETFIKKAFEYIRERSLEDKIDYLAPHRDILNRIKKGEKIYDIKDFKPNPDLVEHIDDYLSCVHTIKYGYSSDLEYVFLRFMELKKSIPSMKWYANKVKRAITKELNIKIDKPIDYVTIPMPRIARIPIYSVPSLHRASSKKKQSPPLAPVPSSHRARPPKVLSPIKEESPPPHELALVTSSHRARSKKEEPISVSPSYPSTPIVPATAAAAAAAGGSAKIEKYKTDLLRLYNKYIKLAKSILPEEQLKDQLDKLGASIQRLKAKLQ